MFGVLIFVRTQAHTVLSLQINTPLQEAKVKLTLTLTIKMLAIALTSLNMLANHLALLHSTCKYDLQQTTLYNFTECKASEAHRLEKSFLDCIPQWL